MWLYSSPYIITSTIIVFIVFFAFLRSLLTSSKVQHLQQGHEGAVLDAASWPDLKSVCGLGGVL